MITDAGGSARPFVGYESKQYWHKYCLYICKRSFSPVLLLQRHFSIMDQCLLFCFRITKHHAVTGKHCLLL
jgi:hypothetical protein